MKSLKGGQMFTLLTEYYYGKRDVKFLPEEHHITL